MHKNKCYVALLFLLITYEKAFSENWVHRLNIESFSLSEPIPVSGILNNNWNHPFEGGEDLFTYNLIKLTAQRKNWQINLQQRFDYYADFSEDAAELVYLEKNRLSAPLNRRYLADLKVNQLRALGLGIAYQWRWKKNVSTSLQFTYWRPDLLTNGRINGVIQTNDDATFDGELNLSYAYTEDLLFERPKRNFSGKGISLDWRFQWGISKKFQLALEVRDIYNRFEWQDATTTEAIVTSNTMNFDDNGFINFTPALRGIEGFSNHSQELPPHYVIDLNYRLGDNEVLAKLSRYNNLNFYRIGFSHPLSSGSSFEWFLDPEHNALTVGINNDDFYFEFTTDSIRLSNARVLGLDLYWQF